jgi:colicin import membrane protein
MSEPEVKTCIYPGCERPAAPPNPLGGPQPAFCDLDEHNALTAHQERRRLANPSDTPVRRNSSDV